MAAFIIIISIDLHFFNPPPFKNLLNRHHDEMQEQIAKQSNFLSNKKMPGFDCFFFFFRFT